MGWTGEGRGGAYLCPLPVQLEHGEARALGAQRIEHVLPERSVHDGVRKGARRARDAHRDARWRSGAGAEHGAERGVAAAPPSLEHAVQWCLGPMPCSRANAARTEGSLCELWAGGRALEV